MSEAKHTPGPWVIGEISHKKQHVEIDAPFGDPTLGYAAWSGVARVYGCNDDKNAGSNVMEGNARLIAAAPELLEYLQYAVWAHPELEKNEKLMAVIAKATAHKEGQ